MINRRIFWFHLSFAIVTGWVFCAPSAHAATTKSNFLRRLNEYRDNGLDVRDQWDEARSQVDSDHGKTETTRYFDDILNFYVKQPVGEHVEEVERAFADYADDVGRMLSGLNIGNTDKLASCRDAPLSKSKIKSYGTNVADEMRQLAISGSIRSTGRGRSDRRSGDEYDKDQVYDSVTGAFMDIDTVGNCCEELRKDRNTEFSQTGKGQTFGEDVCAKLKLDLEEAQKKFQKSLDAALPAPTAAPDPGDVFDGDYQLFGYFLQEHNYLKSALSQARRRGATLADSADAEDEILQNIKSACEKGRDKAQDKSVPISKSLVTNLGKAIKCHILPSIATTSWDLQYQRLTVAGAMVPIEGKDWDVNCDPNETAQYLAMRTDDPAQLARQWGLDTMQNPDYISRLRNLQPTASIPIVANPGMGGGYFTGIGVYGVQPTQINTAANASTGNTVGSTSRGTVSTVSNGTSSSSRRVSASRSLSTASVGPSSRTLATRTAAGSTRLAVANGVGRANQVRTLSTSIRNNQNPVQLASTLKSGATNTRNFTTKIASNNAKLSSSQRRTLNVQSSSTARAVVGKLAGVRGSQSTAQDVLNAIEQGKGNPGGTVGNFADRQAQNAADQQAQLDEQKRLDGLITQAIQNVYDKQQKQRQKIAEIQGLINERDVMVAGVLQEIISKPPKAQADRIQQLRLQLMQKDKEISLLKVEYDGYDAAIAQQNVIAQSLQYNGQNSPYFTPGRGSRGTRGKTTFRPILDLLVPEAFAAVPVSEIDFVGGMKAFVADLRKQIADNKAKETQVLKEAYALYKARGDAITEDNVRDTDSSALIEASLYADALYFESKELVESASDKKSPSNIAANVVSVLVETRDNAAEARKALDTIALQFKESYPLRAEDNPEAWWPMVPAALME